MKSAFFNRMKFIFFATGCIFCSMFFFACANLFSSENPLSDGEKNSEKFYEINGNLFVDGSSPKIFENTNQARSVSANIPDTIFYAVSAKNAENLEKTYTAEVSGSSFSIKLSKGTWNITAEGFSDSKKTLLVLKGSAAVSVEDENSVKSGISIKMLPQKDGKGNISLSIEAENGSGIKSVSAELTKNGEGSSVYSESLNFSGNVAKIEKSEISSGVYTLSLKFYSESDCNGELFYSAQEIVNVFNNLATDNWQGNSVYINGGKFFLSKSAVESFKMNTFFVQGESEATYSPAAAASDSNMGTYFAPFATVQKAVDKINALNNGTAEYTIFVDGTVTADSSGDYSENNNSFVNISPASTLNLTIKSLSSEKAVVDAGRSEQNADSAGWRVFYIGENAKAAFENITVTGGSLDLSGGGIYCGGNLSLKNCVVTENKSNNAGGGISFSGKELVLENTSVTYNESSGNGGGMDADGKVIISGSEILNNSAIDNGGGIYFGDGEKTIFSTTVNKNSAKFGGGIYMQGGILNIESGTVIGEKIDPSDESNDISEVATESDYGNRSTKQISSNTTEHDVGAGIFVESGTVNMEDGAYICRNYTSCAGGGIFIKSGTFNMNGGTVGWNRSNYGGGIFCKGKLNISGNSQICYNKVSTLYVQGFCGRGGGIAVNENGIAVISGSTKIFGNQAVRWSSTNDANSDALGAGIYCAATLKVEGGEIYGNSTESDGAAIGIESGIVTILNCKISSNSAGRNGGAIYANNENSRITVKIGEENNSNGDVLIEKNSANRGGAFYGANNADFVMNAGKVSENYSTGSDSGDGGGAMFLWGANSNYSTFTMNGGKISGNRAKNGGAGGAVHIDHGSGGMASFIMTGGLLYGNKASDENGDGSKLGGAIYVKTGGQIKLSGSAVIAVEDDGNDIWLGNGKTVTITVALTPEKNNDAGKPIYTARITPESYTVGTSLIIADSEVTLKDEVGKFCVTGNDESDEWFITSAATLSKPTAISSFSSVPDFSKYPKLMVSSGDEMKTLADWVNAGNNMAGTIITLQNDVTIDSMICGTDKNFNGTFDGNGNTITSNSTLMSIFYSVNAGGIVKNLTSAGIFSCSGIVNNLYNGTVENCINNAEIKNSTYSRCAGIVGYMSGGNIKNCINNGNISNTCASDTDIGGICGKDVNGGFILNCMNHGDIKTSLTKENCIGGIVGTYQTENNKEGIFNCINLGNIETLGTYDTIEVIVGGILGYVNNFDYYVNIKNCVNTGDVLNDIDMTKGSVIGSCNLTDFNSLKLINISETYCFENTAFSGISQNMVNVKINYFTENFTTTDSLTVEGTTSNDLIELLNAWVTANFTEMEQYLKWAVVDGNPSLVYE